MYFEFCIFEYLYLLFECIESEGYTFFQQNVQEARVSVKIILLVSWCCRQLGAITKGHYKRRNLRHQTIPTPRTI